MFEHFYFKLRSSVFCLPSSVFGLSSSDWVFRFETSFLIISTLEIALFYYFCEYRLFQGIKQLRNRFYEDCFIANRKNYGQKYFGSC